MLAKICSYSNFGSLNPNLKWVFTYGNSIADFRAARYRKNGNHEVGNTVFIGWKLISDSDSETQNYYINKFSPT